MEACDGRSTRVAIPRRRHPRSSSCTPRPRTSCLPPTGVASGSSTISRLGARSLPNSWLRRRSSFPGRRSFSTCRLGGGWPEGDNSFHGPASSRGRSHPYYQRSRHIFGDFKIEVFDERGNLVDTVASSKHRGVNRATWSMRMKAPKVPPAASAMFQAAQGPRVFPGVYTVKMTKGVEVYTTKLNIVRDPRATYTSKTARAVSPAVKARLDARSHELGGRRDYYHPR